MTTRIRSIRPTAARPDRSARIGQVVAAYSCGVASALVLSATAWAGQAPDVRMTQNDGLYKVAAVFEVTAPTAIVRGVLTDYEAIPRFMPGVRLSRVISCHGRNVLLEQELVASVLMFSRRIYLTLDVTAGDDVIVFRDLGGKSFSRYDGDWRLVEDGPTVRVTYQLNAQPVTGVPAFVIRRLLSRDVKDTIDAIAREVARRVGPTAGRQTSGARR